MDRLSRKVLSTLVVGTLGRRATARLGRFLSMEARLDGVNDMRVNGETLVQRVVAERGRSLRVLDVGANVGDWSASMVDQARRAGADLQLTALEPHPVTHRNVAARLGAQAECIAAAASDAEGSCTFFIVGDDAGTNSLHRHHDQQVTGTIVVPTMRLDTFCESRGIAHVHLAKIDTEGHDFRVLSGATGLLRRAAVDVMQFEYNHRWIPARHYLRDVFDLAAEHRYSVGKVTRAGVELYSKWDPELETFREGNYLLLRPECVEWFPRVRWWNE